MFGHETRPAHFFIPKIQAIIGGIFAHIQGWEYIGWMIWGIAAVNTGWLVYTSVKDHDLRRIEQEHHHLGEMMKLDAAKKKTKVAIEKTDLTGFMHQSFNELEIPPGKILKFAREALGGKKLTIREWTPLKKGKLFSDPEWRRLIAFLKQPDWEDKRIKFIVPINANNENDGFELTAAGIKWLKDVVEESVLTPV